MNPWTPLAGRLRPHFIEVCNPNMSMTEAECGSLDSPRYVTQFHCLGQPGLDTAETEARLKDARLSFVSGHASLGTYAMWFCVVYLHQRMVSKVLEFICV